MSEAASDSSQAIRLRLKLRHPNCWVLDVVRSVDVGLLGYGIFTRRDGRATTRYTIYGDDSETIEQGLRAIRDHPSVHGVVEMTTGYRRLETPTPGNASRELLVEHEAATQIADAFTSRGFTYGSPCDTHGDEETWVLYANMDKATIQERLDEIREARNAEITIDSITEAEPAVQFDPIPVDRLSHRQREVFQLARQRGYYRRPKEVTSEELASELGITTSTLHEHLHKAEEKILDQG